MKNLLDPKLDYIFKNIFGKEENKHLLLSLLNSILKGKPLIKSLTLENTEISKILKEDKASRLDVRAKTNDGTTIDIEIQCKNTGEIPARAVNYMANMLPRAINVDDSYNKAHVISIWILGESVTDRVNAISEAYMTFQPNAPDNYEIMTDNARIFFIELPKFNPKDADMHDLLTAWLTFLKNPVFMDDAFLEIEEVKKAMNTLKYISADDDVRAIADLRQRTINDFISEKTVAIENATAEAIKKGREEGVKKGREEGREEGVKKGREEGLAEGIHQKAIESAVKMLNKDVDINDICEFTGLSIDEIMELKGNQHLLD